MTSRYSTLREHLLRKGGTGITVHGSYAIVGRADDSRLKSGNHARQFLLGETPYVPVTADAPTSLTPRRCFPNALPPLGKGQPCALAGFPAPSLVWIEGEIERFVTENMTFQTSSEFHTDGMDLFVESVGKLINTLGILGEDLGEDELQRKHENHQILHQLVRNPRFCPGL